MAVHDVRFTVPERPVGNVDIEFVVRRDGKKMGTLTTGSGKGVTCQSRRVAALPRQNSIGMPHINRSQ
jgi:hypothetical protein